VTRADEGRDAAAAAAAAAAAGKLLLPLLPPPHTSAPPQLPLHRATNHDAMQRNATRARTRRNATQPPTTPPTGTRQHAEYLWRITKDDNQRSLITQEEILE
jgi:hypothetical protein